MFNPDGCFCCEPPEDPCVLSGCTWSSTEMSDADLTAGVTYHNPASGSTPDGTYEVTNVQDATTGNNAPCRKITIETVVAPAKAESVYAICWIDGATFDPQTTCYLSSVSFCVESRRHVESDEGLTDEVVFVVRQNGKIYTTTSPLSSSGIGANWRRSSGTYVSSQFAWVNGTGFPNFSATGSVIEFGFAVKLSVPKDGTPIDVVLFDNVCVTAPCTTCLTEGCEKLMSSGEVTLISSHNKGSGAYTTTAVSIDYTDGVTSAPCIKIVNSPAGVGSSPVRIGLAAAWDLFSLDGFSFDPSPCSNITEIGTCAAVKREWSGSFVGFNGPEFSLFPLVFQGGKTFMHSGFQAIGMNGGVNQGSWVYGRARVSVTSFYELTGFTWPEICASGASCGSATFNASSSPDFSLPFTYGLAVRTRCWGSSTGPLAVTFKFDDYCANAERDC